MLALAICLFAPLSAPPIEVESRPVEVRVAAVDEAGDLLVEGWRVEIRTRPRDEGAGRWKSHPIDPSRGCAIVELERGRYEARVWHTVRLSSRAKTFEVRRDPADVLVRYSGPAPERVLTVDLVNRQRLLRLDDAAVWAVRGEERIELKRSGRTCRAYGVEPGFWSIEIDSPQLVGWRSELLATGSPSRVEVASEANLRVVVRDLHTSLPVAEPSGKLEPGAVILNQAGESSPGTLFADTLAGDASLIVSARGYTTRRIDIDALRVGEKRSVEVMLEPAGALELQVVDAAGRAVSGVGVELDWREPLPGSGGGLPWTYVSVTGGDGDVFWHTVAPGRYVLRVPGAAPVTLDLGPGVKIERRVVVGEDG